MTDDNSIDFWFSIGSTYSYLSVIRLPEVQQAEGLVFRWRPFNVRQIMREMDNRHLAGKPVKYRYMWRDIERRATNLGVAATVPVPHPIAELDTANRVAILGMEEGWGADYVRATLHALVPERTGAWQRSESFGQPARDWPRPGARVCFVGGRGSGLRLRRRYRRSTCAWDFRIPDLRRAWLRAVLGRRPA